MRPGQRWGHRGGHREGRRLADQPVRITSAPRSREDDIRGRERRYVISMGIRTVCFLLAVASIGHWFMWVFMAAAVFLPYVAVVMANAGATPDPGPEAYEAPRPALDAPSESRGRLGEPEPDVRGDGLP